MNILGADVLANLEIEDLGELDNLSPPPMDHAAHAIGANILDTSIGHGFNADFVRKMGGYTI
ncbi:MAG: hypothetical protein AAF988_00680 [Pseudomonadota bacterium]